MNRKKLFRSLAKQLLNIGRKIMLALTVIPLVEISNNGPVVPDFFLRPFFDVGTPGVPRMLLYTGTTQEKRHRARKYI